MNTSPSPLNRRFPHVIALVACLLIPAWTTWGGGIEDLVTDAKLWERTRGEFTDAYRELGFRWTSRDKRECRAVGDLSLTDGIPVEEVLVRFEDDAAAAVALSIYNRGDAGDIAFGKFTSIGENLTRWLGQTCDSRGRQLDGLRATGIRRKARQWRKTPHLYRLEWAVSTVVGQSDHRPEYIRLELLPAATAGGTLGDRTRTPTPLELRQNVAERENGDQVIEGIPMVDQGQKGYCAVAVMDRVLTYLGRDVDQHELAQIADTGTRGGTDPESLRKALRRFAGHFKIHVGAIQEFDMDELRDLVRDYNRQADRAEKPEIELPDHGVILLNDIYRAMEPKLVVAARESDRTGMNNFRNAVRRGIRDGVPLVWSVMLGVVKEPGLRQAGGGHMRLIIGHNPDTDEILYSDTWGRGHEEKRMPLAHAWAITTNLYRIMPR